MSGVGAHPDLVLEAEDAAALETLVAGLAEAVTAVLAAAVVDGPICSVALAPGQDEGLEVLPVIYAGRVADRRRVLAESGGDWTEAWNVYAYRDEADVIHPHQEITDDDLAVDRYDEVGPALGAAWERVRAAVEDRCLRAEDWVWGRVAHRLNRRALPLPVTDDVAVWVFDHGAGPGDLLEMLEAVLRPETLALLLDAGVIGPDEEAEDGF